MRARDLWKLKVLMPWNNLGCLGVKSADRAFYADLFLNGRRAGQPMLRAFVHDQVTGARRWYTLTWSGWQLDQVEVTAPETFARVARRTIKPWAIVTHVRTWLELEVVSYPFVAQDGTVKVYARRVVGEPMSAEEVECDDLRPLNFQRCTGVPANDPLVCLERSES